MAKLKNFNNVNDFQNFIKSDEFVEPDISTINHTQTQYMPVDVLQLNVKEKLAPNEENFKALINTNNNGKVNVWYKKSTASNYTKLDTNDVVYTSGYTQHLNEIMFNTVNSQLDNTSNMIYVVSGRNDTNTSMTISKEIIQYGLITLDGTTFDATGGSKTVQLKTEASNVWKIIGVPAWLSFSKTSGVGPASITVTAEEYTTTNIDRSTYVILSYNINGITYQINSNAIIQTKADEPTPPPEPKYFYMGDSLENAIYPNYTYPTNIPANVSSANYHVYYKTNYDTSELTLSPATDTTANFDHSSNRIYFNVTKNNEDTTPKTFTINIKHNGTTVGTLTINQNAAEAKYFKWSNNQQNITYTVSSASTTLTETYTTNYSGITFECDGTVCTAVTKNSNSISYTIAQNNVASNRTGYVYAKYNGTTVGTLTVNQSAAETKYFKWSNNQQNITYAPSSASTTLTETYTTNYSNITFECDGTVCTAVTKNSNSISYTIAQNDIESERTGYVYAKYNGTTVGTLTINQSAAEAKYFKWSNGQQDITYTPSSASTTLTETYTTNYPRFMFLDSDIDGTVVTSVRMIGDGSRIEYTVSQNDTESGRTGYIKARGGNTGETLPAVVGTLTVNQQPGKKDYSSQYLTFKIKGDGNIKWYANSSIRRTIEYSRDNGTNWTEITSNTGSSAPSISVNAGDTIIFKGTNATYSDGMYNAFFYIKNIKIDVEGNIMSLIYGDDFKNKTSFPSGSNANFFLFFTNCDVESAENLILPATTLTESCYNGMFAGCTSLVSTPALPATTLASQCYYDMFDGCTGITTAPALPADTLVERCYSQMFSGCTSLVSTPALPATTLAVNCYTNMFRGCTSLVSAPALPATTLVHSCYSQMFYGCTNLVAVPELPATTLVQQCYYYMFYACSSLKYIKCLATDISATYCTNNWVQGVSSTGTFIKAASMTGWPRNNSGIPPYWTEQNA